MIWNEWRWIQSELNRIESNAVNKWGFVWITLLTFQQRNFQLDIYLKSRQQRERKSQYHDFHLDFEFSTMSIETTTLKQTNVRNCVMFHNSVGSVKSTEIFQSAANNGWPAACMNPFAIGFSLSLLCSFHSWIRLRIKSVQSEDKSFGQFFFGVFCSSFVHDFSVSIRVLFWSFTIIQGCVCKFSISFIHKNADKVGNFFANNFQGFSRFLKSL